jgi:membrane protein
MSGGLLRATVRDWFAHRCMSKGAALAFYALFSLAPILVMAIVLVGLVFGREVASVEIMRQLEALLGHEGATVVAALIQSAGNPLSGGLASLIALATLVIGSTTAFAELKDSLDEIWSERGVRSSGIASVLRDRLLSFGLVLVLAFLLLVSLIVNAAAELMARYWATFAGWESLTASLANATSLALVTALFAAIYKLLPPVRLGWGDVLVGAVITAALFEVGKYFIGLYLGNAPVTSTLGAAGSLGVLALWVYYSAQIFFLGAEFTRQYALRHGSLSRADPAGTTLARQGTPVFHPNREPRSDSP